MTATLVVARFGMAPADMSAHRRGHARETATF